MDLLKQMTDSALPGLRASYVNAVIATAEGDPAADEFWAEFRRMMFRVLLFSNLIARMEALQEAKKQGMVVGVAKEDLTGIGANQFDAGEELITGPFIEAIDLFNGRIPRLKSTIEEITPAIRQMSFWVTGVEQTTALGKIQAAITNVLDPEKASGLAGFVEMMQDDLGLSLTDARLETVYRTNVVQALSDGRDAQLNSPDLRSEIALWQLNEIQDNRTRGNPGGMYPDAGPHFQMDGFIESPSHTVWRKIGWPGPGGFNCRRSVSPIGWSTAISKGWANEDRTLNQAAIDQHNGRRWDFINSGEYPDRGFGA